MADRALEELLASTVDVDEVDDRTSFYLTHRSLIETWAQLRRDASSAVLQALQDLAGPLAEDLRSL